mgnify:FL=1
MKKSRKFSVRKFLLFLLSLIVILFLALIITYKTQIGPVSENTSPKAINVEKGENYFTLASKLKEQNLIKSEFFYKLYLKLNKPSSLVNGTYKLNEAMSVSEIVRTLSDKDNQKDTTIKITFREGLNVRQMADIIATKTNIKSEDFINKVSDKTYINSLKDKYWFITDDMFNTQIYYPLEGNLYPDTYHFEANELNLETIITKILDNTKIKLDSYKTQIEESGYTVHQILTLASMVELEAVSDTDRAKVAGVFYNRIKDGWSLGSDVTTYYSAKKSMTDALTKSELNACNGYNTRCTSMKGLPVGPIDSPSISSVKAAINPEKTDYYYFVADTNRKVYFTKNAKEHAQIISKLKEEGIWAA